MIGSVVFSILLWKQVDDEVESISVIVYLVFLVTMTMMGVLRSNHTNYESAIYVNAGNLLFLISDVIISMIVFFKFPQPWLEPLTLQLYYLCFMSLAHGFKKHVEECS